MKAQPNLDQLSNEQLRAMADQLLVAVEQKEDLIQRKEQASLLEELIGADTGNGSKRNWPVPGNR
jgi:hypothetical protein